KASFYVPPWEPRRHQTIRIKRAGVSATEQRLWLPELLPGLLRLLCCPAAADQPQADQSHAQQRGPCGLRDNRRMRNPNRKAIPVLERRIRPGDRRIGPAELDRAVPFIATNSVGAARDNGRAAVFGGRASAFNRKGLSR